MINKKNVFVIVILFSLVAAACGGAAATPTPTKAPVVADSGVVIAEGRLQPKQYAAISFAVGGQIAEVLVSEGAQVKKDEVILRLKNREALQAEVSRADQERINADQAVKDLKDTANVATAQALLDLSKAKDA
ncbi:MAG: biotin/lipoyl-binding protein, partial [Chloroflexi bacterium]|nr:biotin/lipoyl-binding protein [Chloroflexota bacterium]